MNDYQKLVRDEAKAFLEQATADYEGDDGEFGARSSAPNFSKWMDSQGQLVARIETVSARWGHKECLWVQQNTRNKSPGGGDPKSRAFASLLQDVRQEVKKLVKARREDA
jgi:hypothetical protein